MAFEVSEYRCKRKYKSRRSKFPLFRLIIVFALVFLGFHLGFFSFIVDKLSSGNENASLTKEEAWDVSCRKFHGTSFQLNEGLSQCSWILRDSMPLLPNGFLRYVASMRETPNSKLHWVAPTGKFNEPVLVQRDDASTSTYLRLMLEDSSFVWINESTGCRFPGLCPQKPLNFSSLPITEDFDFDGQESLLATDVLRGIGEAPVHPILSGKIIHVGRDSMGYSMEIDHGNNITSRMSGMYPPVAGPEGENAFAAGDTVGLNTVIGRLAPKDSSVFFMTVRRNGAFVRWDDFYSATHPVDSAKISKFKKSIGL